MVHGEARDAPTARQRTEEAVIKLEALGAKGSRI
jgi:hypothetical protein